MKLTRFNELTEEDDIIEGEWTLNDDHELEYRETENEKFVRLTAPLIAAEPDALVFAITSKEQDHKTVTSLAKLAGTWRANDKNQLVFEIQKQGGQRDVLTFRGAFQTKSLLAKEGEIRYQVGVEVYGKKRIQEITFFGKWKLSRDLELIFEIECADGKKRALSFGAEYHLGKDRTIEARLISRERDPLGLEVIFTRDFLEDEGQFFLRLRRSLEESAVEAGVRIRW